MIVPAKKEHLDQVVQLLAKEYKNPNTAFGAPLYQEEYSALLPVIEERIVDPKSAFGTFVYLAEGSEKVSGLVMTLLQKERGEALMLVAEEGNGAMMTELLQYAVESLKQSGAKQIRFEVAPHEVHYQQAVQKMGARHLTSQFVLVE